MSNNQNPFAFAMKAKVKVHLSQCDYVGEIISRLESHTGGVQYAVWAKYKHATGAEWFAEREIALACDLSEAARHERSQGDFLLHNDQAMASADNKTTPKEPTL